MDSNNIQMFEKRKSVNQESVINFDNGEGNHRVMEVKVMDSNSRSINW